MLKDFNFLANIKIKQTNDSIDKKTEEFLSITNELSYVSYMKI